MGRKPKSAQSTVLELIKQLVGQANVLTIPRLFVDLAGSLEAALFLSQLLYWSDKGQRVDGFIFKSRREWVEETALSDYAVRKAGRRLQELGLVETQLLRANAAPTLHYRLDREALAEALSRFVEFNKSDLSDSTNGFADFNKSDLLEPTKHEHRSPETTSYTDDDGTPLTAEQQAIYDLLASREVDPDVAQELATDGRLDLTDWRYWEQRADHDRRIKHPAGYLVSKGRKGAKAPTCWRDGGHQEISELAERPPSPREQVMSQYKIDAGTMDLWDRVATDLKGQMAWGTFDQHLTGAVLFPVKNGQVVVGIKRKQSRDWLENRLAPTVQRTLARHLGQEQIDLSFRVLT